MSTSSDPPLLPLLQFTPSTKKEGHFYINEEWIRGESVEEHLYLQGPFSKR